jgi:hypothetical protein
MNPAKRMIDDLEPLNDKPEKKNKKKESLEDILSAVKEKSDVVKPLPKEKLINTPTRSAGLIVEEDGSIKSAGFRETIKKDIVPEELSCNNKVLKMAEYFAHPFKYFFLRFFSGMFFTFGVCAALLVITIALFGLRNVPFFAAMLKKVFVLLHTIK